MVLYDPVDVSKLNKIINKYSIVAGKDLQDVIVAKGDQIRYNLFTLYRKVKGKSGKGGKVFWGDLKNRSAANRGTKIRVREILARFNKNLPQVDKNGKQLTAWQQLVYQEISRRSRGIGLLGASFIAKKNSLKSGKSTLITNVSHTLGTIGSIKSEATQDGQSVEILGFAPGLYKIGNKYGILQQAVDMVVDDTEVYLKRKLGDSWRKL